MAIPDNYIDKITKDGESRMISPAADKVRVDSEHYEGDNLDDVLDEIAEAIDEAGSGDGTVKGVKVGGTTYDPDSETGVVDLSTPIANKVDKVPRKGLSTNDYTDADKEAVATISSKANASEVANTYATKNELTSGLSGKQNTLTFDDAPGNTDNPVKSRGIKQAIELVTPTIDANGKWVIGGVSTNHDAHGPMGNITIEDAEDMVALIVNDLTTGGQTSFLSAEMGKALLSVLLQIFGNLGEYAFPNGKPTLNFNTQISFPINYSTSDLHVTYADGQGGTAPTSVELLGRLEIQLGTNNDLYVINESAVKVFVGGTEVSNAYDPTTDKIIIPEVYGNVVIIASAMTYVSDRLVLHLDGKHQGENAAQWENLVDNNKPLVLSGGYTKGTDHVEFDGTDGFGLIDGYNEALPFESTSVESVLSFDSLANVVNTAMLVMANCKNQSIALQFTSSGNVIGATQAEGATAPIAAMGTLANAFAANEKVRVVEYGNDFMLNNTAVNKSGTDKFIIVPNNTSTYSQGYGDLCVSGYYTRAGAYMYPFDGKIFAIRIYSKKLSVDELTQNWKVDKKRFNIS